MTQLLNTTHNMRKFQQYNALVANLNLVDGVSFGSGGGCAWTPGCAQVDTVDEEPFLDNPWQLQSWSLRYQLFASLTGADIPQDVGSNGVFSGLYAGIMVNNANLQTGLQTCTVLSGTVSGPGCFTPYLANPMPASGGTIAQVWDGGINDPFPPNVSAGISSPFGAINNPGSLNSLVVDQQLPQAIQMGSGDTLSCGLWLPPSLMGGSTDTGSGGLYGTTALYVANAQFTIAYTAERP